jgi:2-keto-4-pentenoate hydratase/2-oxohepta-3-ene-1,7-dioic acid hydratase in catechol pathway
VVDLPDAVGHPAFPGTMERLVKRNGGTVLDAARAALERDEAKACVVAGARLLPPILPTALRSLDAAEGSRRLFGPEDEIPWPEGAGWLELHPKIAAVLRRPVEGVVTPEEAAGAVFGYTLVGDFLARSASGDPVPTPDGVPLSLGPCIATAEELDPQTSFVTVRVDGHEWAKGNLNGTAGTLLDQVARASRTEKLSAGEAFASSPFGPSGPEHRVWPGAEIELEAEGLGVLRFRLGRG